MIPQPTPYTRHLSQLRGFSDGAGSQPMNKEYYEGQDYMSGWITGRTSRHMFAEVSAKALGVELSEIKPK